MCVSCVVHLNLSLSLVSRRGQTHVRNGSNLDEACAESRRCVTFDMMRSRHCRYTLSLVALLLSPAIVSSAGEYDPCYDGRAAVAKGDLWTVGIAYFPNVDTDGWSDLNPCGTNGRVNLTTGGGASAVYRAKVDDMSFMRSTMADENAIMTAANADLMTVVAYASNGLGQTIRSQPRRVRATSSTASLLSPSTGRVNALTLIARFDEGRLAYLQWHDMACRGCDTSDTCFDVGDGHGACAGTEVNCGCTADSGCVLDLDNNADALRCHLTVAAAFSGKDVNKVPLTTFSQIERLGLYSVSGSAKGAGVSASSAVSK